MTKSCLTIKRMQIVEIRTVAKSLPPLRRKTHKSLILSYSADFSVIFYKKSHRLLFLSPTDLHRYFFFLSFKSHRFHRFTQNILMIMGK